MRSGWLAHGLPKKCRHRTGIPGSRRFPGMPRAGLAGGGAQNHDDTRIPEEDGYICWKPLRLWRASPVMADRAAPERCRTRLPHPDGLTGLDAVSWRYGARFRIR